MTIDREVMVLLENLRDRRVDRAGLARWMAQHSWHWYESGTKLERQIVAELDAALSEVQQGTKGERGLPRL